MPQSKSYIYIYIYTSFNNLAIRLYVEHLITEDQNSHCRNDLATKTFGHNIDAWQLIKHNCMVIAKLLDSTSLFI